MSWRFLLRALHFGEETQPKIEDGKNQVQEAAPLNPSIATMFPASFAMLNEYKQRIELSDMGRQASQILQRMNEWGDRVQDKVMNSELMGIADNFVSQFTGMASAWGQVITSRLDVDGNGKLATQMPAALDKQVSGILNVYAPAAGASAGSASGKAQATVPAPANTNETEGALAANIRAQAEQARDKLNPRPRGPQAEQDQTVIVTTPDGREIETTLQALRNGMAPHLQPSGKAARPPDADNANTIAQEKRAAGSDLSSGPAGL